MASPESFDPDGVGIANGNLFGFPVKEKEADIVVIPVPWDVTASYGKGTSNGPQAILDASTQLDFYHHKLLEAHLTKVFLTPISKEWKELNDRLCLDAVRYIQFLEAGGKPTEDEEFSEIIEIINQASHALTSALEERCAGLLDEGKLVGILGGEHSTPLGLIQALNNKYESFGILQIDAHADLREAYEGFEQSHASIMFNVLQNCPNMTQLVQVGIRDVANIEVTLANQERVTTFYDWYIKEQQFTGTSWKDMSDQIIQCLPENVYISFDIDGLMPSLCPNTGTPVPGGFTLEEVGYLIFRLVESGRRIIGFDLNEVSPGKNDDWDANVGARALWQLICATELSRRQAGV
jgi:agmatinase